MDARIRNTGYSGSELWLGCDQQSLEPINLDSQAIIAAKHTSRLSNHDQSSRSKAHGQSSTVSIATIHQGNIVGMVTEYSKTGSRPEYLVEKKEDPLTSTLDVMMN